MHALIVSNNRGRAICLGAGNATATRVWQRIFGGLAPPRPPPPPRRSTGTPADRTHWQATTGRAAQRRRMREQLAGLHDAPSPVSPERDEPVWKLFSMENAAVASTTAAAALQFLRS